MSGLDAIQGSLELRILLETDLNVVEEPLVFTIETESVWYEDQDGDGFGNANSSTFACSAPDGFVSNSLDCNDATQTIYPGAPELCDNLDNNCNAVIDEGLLLTTFLRMLMRTVLAHQIPSFKLALHLLVLFPII
jgi:hypothetical protein